MIIRQSWIRAVEKDCTVIVLDAGTSLRVGIRHRARQTLYLSDVVDLSGEGDQAPFTKIVFAIVLAMIHDARMRIPLLENRARPSRKRSLSGAVDQPAPKRSKQSSGTGRKKDVYIESRSFQVRRLVLLAIHIDHVL